MSRAHQTPAYRAWRKQVLAHCDPTCIRCGYPVDMQLRYPDPMSPSADHDPPLSETGEVAPSLEAAGIAHLQCNRSHGGRLGARATNKVATRTSSTRSTARGTAPRAKNAANERTRFLEDRQITPAPPVSNTPETSKDGPERAVEGLILPDGVRAPRLESGRHRAATGSYGAEAREWLAKRYSMEVRGWQGYVLDRALEHDADGRLVWPTVIVTVSRQQGKSYLARGLCMWRMFRGQALWGGEQTVLHVANKRETAMEVMRPAGRWVDGRGLGKVKWGNTFAGIELPSGDRWLIHAANESAGVDEAWKIKRTVVDDAIAPTMAERPSPQLWLVSTAGDSESDLLIAYRQRALDRLGHDDPGDVLLLEWSAPPEADPDLEETWAWASPEWSDRRAAFLRSQWANVEESAWRTQWLNQWVARADHWLKDSTWAGTLDRDRPLPVDRTWTIAMESDFDGMGHAVAVAAQDGDGRIVVRVTTHRTMKEANDQVAQVRAEHPACQVFATPSFIDRITERIDGIVGQREAAAATQALLDAFDRKAIAHDGNQTLLEHIGHSTIARRQAGWTLAAPMGKAGVYAARAVMFAVWQASKVQKPAAAVHVRRRPA